MRSGLVRAEDVVVLQLGVHGHVDGLNGGEIEDSSDSGAFRTGAIIPADIDDQRVVELAKVFHGLNDPANLMVRVSDISAKYFRLMGKDLLLRGVERIPLRADCPATG